MFSLIIAMAGFFTEPTEVKMQKRAQKETKRMKAKDYYEDVVQVHFLEAVEKGDIKKMGELLKEGADVNAVGREQIRPLFWAVGKRSLVAFEFLLKNGADPNFYMEDMDNHPFHHKPSLMEWLTGDQVSDYLRVALQYGGDPDFIIEHYYPDGRLSSRAPIIFSAIKVGGVENLRILIEAGADINWQIVEFSYKTPLIEAVFCRKFDMVYLLLEKGAEPTLKIKSGSDLASLIKEYNARGSYRDKKQYEKQYGYYIKVIDKLKKQGLIESDWEPATEQ